MCVKTVKILVGCPASGKSTYAKNFIKNNPHLSCVHISRDEIRFSLLTNEDAYFSKEDEVYTAFISKIRNAFQEQKEVIIVDATHITRASRARLLVNLAIPTDYEVEFIVFEQPLEVLLERNAGRAGFAKVPEKALISMYDAFCMPSFMELWSKLPSEIAFTIKKEGEIK